MNKKGSLADSIYVPMYLMVIAFTMFTAFFIWITFKDNFTVISDTVILPDGRNLTAITDEITVSISYLDYMFPFMVLGLLIVSLVFAFRTGSSVIYSYVSIFFWVLALMMSAIFANVFEQFASNLSSVGSYFTIVSFMMENIKWVCLAWAFLISIVMFTRSKQEDQQLASAERAFG